MRVILVLLRCSELSVVRFEKGSELTVVAPAQVARRGLAFDLISLAVFRQAGSVSNSPKTAVELITIFYNCLLRRREQLKPLDARVLPPAVQRAPLTLNQPSWTSMVSFEVSFDGTHCTSSPRRSR